MKRPKYHFATIVKNTQGTMSLVTLPFQTFGQIPVPAWVLVKDIKGQTVVARMKKKGFPGAVYFTTSLRPGHGFVKAADLHFITEAERNVLYSDALDAYERLIETINANKQ